MALLPDRASQRNNSHAEGWLVTLPGGHGWLVGDRRQALREFAGLVEIERWGRA